MHSIINERLQILLQHADVIAIRISMIKDAEDFTGSEQGGILLDSLITRLQALSENIKNIQKIDPNFFTDFIPLDVTPIIRFRDLASHHYELLNYGIIFSICKAEVPPLKTAMPLFLKKE